MSETYIDIKTLTWPRETNNLFDYEAKNHYKSNYQTSQHSFLLTRAMNHCFLTDLTTDSSSDTSNLLSIIKSDETYIIHQADLAESFKLWLVIKNLPSSSYEMKEGDIFKLGRESLRVKRICSQLEHPSRHGEVSDTPSEKSCKICCIEEVSEEDPLITPCKCSGSLKYIHFVCLKNWLKSKVTSMSTANVSVYQWSDFVCELCKTPLPEIFQFKGRTLSLIEIAYPSSPYIILEEIKSEETDKQTIYVVGLEESQSINIGRGNDSEIRLSDISVSRTHAKIKYNNNKFVIFDNKSKFGTLVSVCKHVVLSTGNEVTLQINRTVVSIAMKQPWKCCLKEKIQPSLVIRD